MRWREILEEYSMTNCRCEKTFNGARCLNYGALHIKGHQFNLRGPHAVRSGAFKSTFPQSIDSLCEDLMDQLRPLFASASRYNWNRSLWDASKERGMDKLVSNRTCLTCLSRTPNHILPCNHVFCDPCIVDLQSVRSENVMVVLRCPLGCQWNVDHWVLARKPREAGVRVLSLDGLVLLSFIPVQRLIFCV